MIELNGDVINTYRTANEVGITFNAKVSWLSREPIQFILPYGDAQKIFATEFGKHDKITALNGKKIIVLIHV